MFSDRAPPSGTDTASFRGGGGSMPEVSHLGWGRWSTLREIENATDGFADENVIGGGGHGLCIKGFG